MAFEKLMDKAAYRRMSNEELELRRADVADELENPESEFTAEEMRGEVAMLKDEEERRSAAAALKIQERAMVAASATPEDVIDSTETEEAKAVRTAPTSLASTSPSTSSSAVTRRASIWSLPPTVRLPT